MPCHTIRFVRSHVKLESTDHLSAALFTLHVLRLNCLNKQRAQELSTANRDKRLSFARKLLRRYPARAVDMVFFTDEKVFTVAPQVYLQNDRVYTPATDQKYEIAADRLRVLVVCLF